MKDIVKLPDGTYVNPKYVVRIEAHTCNAGKTDLKTYVWTLDGGYATTFEGDRRDELAVLLFGALPKEES